MKKYTCSLVLAAAMLALAPTSQTLASKNRSNGMESAAGSISVKQLPTYDGYVCLQVQLNSGKAARFKVTDDSGELLYSNRVNAGGNTVVLKFSPDEVDMLKLVLSTEDGVAKKVFRVDRQSITTASVVEL
jgi:hypothetical protein